MRYFLNDDDCSGSKVTPSPNPNPNPGKVDLNKCSNTHSSKLKKSKGRHKGLAKREGERTISQIIWKDYRGFSQITLSTERERDRDQESRKG